MAGRRAARSSQPGQGHAMPLLAPIVVTLCVVYSGGLGQSELVDPVSGVAFTLYRERWTWQRAYDHCVSVGQRLAVIDNSSKQEAVNRFTDIGHAWIGGRRSPDVTWRWISGKEYEYDDGGMMSHDNQSREWCGMHNSTSGSTPSLSPRCCTNTVQYALCQKRASGGGGNTTYSRISVRGTWFAARLLCLDQGGDLAHPDPDQSLHEWWQLVLPHLRSTEKTWIGVVRRPWLWITGNSGQDGKPMVYTHLSNGEGSGNGEDCLHLDMTVNGNHFWWDKTCSEKSKLFICDNGTEDAKLSLGVTPTGGGGRDSGLPPLVPVLGGVSCTVVLLVVMAIVVMIIVRNKRRRRTDAPTMWTDGDALGHIYETVDDVRGSRDGRPSAHAYSEVVLPVESNSRARVSGTPGAVTIVTNGVTQSACGGQDMYGGVAVYAIPFEGRESHLSDGDLQMEENRDYGQVNGSSQCDGDLEMEENRDYGQVDGSGQCDVDLEMEENRDYGQVDGSSQCEGYQKMEEKRDY